MTKTHTGSCHCGAVRFEPDIDLSAGTNKCNCSICAKTRNRNAIIKPAAFRLLAGEKELSDYRFGGKSAHQESQELVAAPIRFADGRNNDWGAAPHEVRHL